MKSIFLFYFIIQYSLVPAMGLFAEQNSTPRRIILITIDTLRADHLGCYGYNRDTSPFIDAWAKENVLYERSYASSSQTLPSIASLMSGYYPHETKAISNYYSIHPQIPTIPFLIAKKGFYTAAIVSNIVLSKKAGFAEGFDWYDDEFPSPVPNRKQPEKKASETTKRAIALMEKIKDKKFFLWLHYMDPHGPYLPPKKFEEKFARKKSNPRILKVNKTLDGKNGIPTYQKLGKERDFWVYFDNYDAEIAYLDEQLSLLFKKIRELNFLTDSLIILTADHGESLGEDEYFFSHGETLRPELLHVPLLIYNGKDQGRVKNVVQISDIPKTILSTFRGEKAAAMPGQNLLDLPNLQESGVYSELGKEYESFISGEWMYSRKKDGHSFATYNVLKMNRSPLPPALGEKLQENLDKASRRKAIEVSEHYQKNEVDKEALRSLGY